MSAYTDALAELVALPRRLEDQIARSKLEVARERERREGEINTFVAEHEAVLVRLERVLERARDEGVDVAAGGAGEGRTAESDAADPLDYAGQLVTRLDEALRNLLYTRGSLAAEEAKLSEEERRRVAEERRRREKEELRRSELWERARQGNVVLLVALAAVAAIGMLAAAAGSAVLLAVPPLAAVLCFALAGQVVSGLPAVAVQRAGGTSPPLPSAPPREARLGAAGYAAAALGLCGLGMAVVGYATGAPSPVPLIALLSCVCGLVALVVVWSVLPRSE